MKTKAQRKPVKFIQRNIFNIIIPKKIEKNTIRGREILYLLPSHCI